MWLTATASTRTSTSPSPGWGSGTSSSFRTSGPPASLATMARMARAYCAATPLRRPRAKQGVRPSGSDPLWMSAHVADDDFVELGRRDLAGGADGHRADELVAAAHR